MEQRGVKQEREIVFLRLHLAAVNIRDIGKQLEGIERNANGKQDIGQNRVKAENRLQSRGKEIGILEKAEDEKAGCNRHKEDCAAIERHAHASQRPPRQPTDKGHGKQEKQERRTAPCVKNQGKDEKHGVLPPQRFAGIDQRHAKNKEKEKKEKSRKNHSV